MRRRDLTFSALGAAGFAVGLLAHGLAHPRSSWLIPALSRGTGEEVTLSFDDGPSPYTTQVLDILSAHGVKAVFFLCGRSVERHPEIARRIVAEGHEVGNHTWSHPYLHLLPRERIAAEIDRTQEAVERVTGRRPRLFRPPYGVRWFPLRGLLEERGLTMMLWSDRGYDARYDAEGIAAASLADLGPGSILLLHDGFEAAESGDRSAMVEALPFIIAGARAKGLAFPSLPARLAAGP